MVVGRERDPPYIAIAAGQCGLFFLGNDIPDAQGAVAVATDQELTRVGEGNCKNGPTMFGKQGLLLAGGGVPQAQRGVVAAGGQGQPIGRKRDRPNRSFMPLHGSELRHRVVGSAFRLPPVGPMSPAQRLTQCQAGGQEQSRTQECRQQPPPARAALFGRARPGHEPRAVGMFQVVTQQFRYLGSGGDAIRRPLGVQPLDNRRQPVGNCSIDLPNWPRRCFADLAEHSQGRVRRERLAAGAERVQHAAQAEEVGARVHGFAQRLFRGHVHRRAGDNAGLSEPGLVGNTCQAEIADLDRTQVCRRPFRLQQDVRRLDVPVNQAVVMGGGQRRSR